MYHTYRLILLDTEMKDKRFNPWEALGMVMPMNPMDGFGSPEIKRAYRQMARKFHPDKTMRLPEAEQKAGAKTWELISKAYECLTHEGKFNNWVEYGNPDGSLVRQSIDIAVPSWMFDPKN